MAPTKYHEAQPTLKINLGLLSLSLFTTVILVLHTGGIYPLRFLTEMEYKAYDARLRFTLPGGIDPRIVIIDIDENSLASQGGWPWPRHKLARLTDTLFDTYNVEVLGYDVVFPEADDDETLLRLREIANDQAVGETIKALLEETSGDDQFASALQANNVVLGYAFDSNTSSTSVGQLPDPVLEHVSLDLVNAPRANRYTANLPIFQSGAAGGYFSLLNSVDSDGIIRRHALLNKFGDGLYESFSLAVARNYLGLDLDPVIDDSDPDYPILEGLDLGVVAVILDHQASVNVPYQGPSGSYRYISAEDILSLHLVYDPGWYIHAEGRAEFLRDRVSEKKP